MTDHLYHRAEVGDLVVSTMRVKWLPPYDLLRVASIDDDGWATSFRSIDGQHHRARGPFETVFRFRFQPEFATKKKLEFAQAAISAAESIRDIKEALRPWAEVPVDA